ncbi:MAG: Kelch repeat-containing protein [bacterium]
MSFGLLLGVVNSPPASAPEARWTQIHTDLPNTPSPRFGQGMVYDTLHGRVILFSGVRENINPEASWADTWEWDGRTWRKVSETGPVRYSFGMAFDPDRNVTFLYGGYNHISESIDPNTYSAVTWTWDGKEWKGIDRVDDAPRVGVSLVYYPDMRCVIRHGGSEGRPAQSNIKNDTWKWDGAMWVKIAAGPARAFHKMVYDSIRNTILLFGGVDQPGTAPGDTWEFDGTNWIQVSTEGPDGREAPGLAFDESRGAAVLYGGAHWYSAADHILHNDTWEWDGFNWVLIPSSEPGYAYMTDMTYDSRRRQIVLFRGAGSENHPKPDSLNYIQETWEYGIPTSGMPLPVWEGQSRRIDD